jgi:hypothetical protein
MTSGVDATGAALGDATGGLIGAAIGVGFGRAVGVCSAGATPAEGGVAFDGVASGNETAALALGDDVSSRGRGATRCGARGAVPEKTSCNETRPAGALRIVSRTVLRPVSAVDGGGRLVTSATIVAFGDGTVTTIDAADAAGFVTGCVGAVAALAAADIAGFVLGGVDDGAIARGELGAGDTDAAAPGAGAVVGGDPADLAEEFVVVLEAGAARPFKSEDAERTHAGAESSGAPARENIGDGLGSVGAAVEMLDDDVRVSTAGSARPVGAAIGTGAGADASGTDCTVVPARRSARVPGAT